MHQRLLPGACDPTATSGGVKGGEQWAVVTLHEANATRSVGTATWGWLSVSEAGGSKIATFLTPPVTAYGGDSPLINAGAKIR